jgi:hypothetical protein
MNFKETFLNTVIRSWPQLIKGFSPFFDLIHLERGMKLFSLQDITYVWRGKEESFINGLKSSYSRLVYLQGYNANRWFANENFDRVYLINGSTAVTEAPYLDLELICILRGHVTAYIISAL